MTQDIYECITVWQAAKTALDAAKEAENTARLSLAPFFAANDFDGTFYVPLMNGWRLKGVFGTNYNVSKELLPDVLNELQSTGNEGSFIADRLFTYSPKLALKEYKGLSDTYKKIADACITTSVATPAIELVEPKAKKA